jgi:hypothetical protein
MQKTETIRILNYAHVRYTALACTMELRAAAKIFLLRTLALRVRVQAGSWAFARRLVNLL